MIKIIQNIKEFGSRVISLVLANKGLSMGIAAFVVLGTVGGVYLYSSYNNVSDGTQIQTPDTTFSGRVSEGLSKLSAVQKFGLVSAMPVLTGLYKVLNTPQRSFLGELVKQIRIEAPTRLRVIFCSKLSKVFIVTTVMAILGEIPWNCKTAIFWGPVSFTSPWIKSTEMKVDGSQETVTKYETVPGKVEIADVQSMVYPEERTTSAPNGGEENIFCSIKRKGLYYTRLIIPFVCNKIMTMVSVSYFVTFEIAKAISRYSACFLFSIIFAFGIITLILHRKPSYLYPLVKFPIELLKQFFNKFVKPVLNFLRMAWDPLLIQTFEDTYFETKLIGTRIIESRSVWHPFVALPQTIC